MKNLTDEIKLTINQDFVLLDGVLFCPSKSTADWGKVWAELGSDR